jgi:hypothetical protein
VFGLLAVQLVMLDAPGNAQVHDFLVGTVEAHGGIGDGEVIRTRALVFQVFALAVPGLLKAAVHIEPLLQLPREDIGVQVNREGSGGIFRGWCRSRGVPW